MRPRPPAPPAPPVLAASLAIGLVSFAMYVATLAPTIAGGDSGELTAAAFSGGVPHPPGYPLFALLAKAWALLPLGEIAWRLNLFSASAGAAATGVLCATVIRWTGHAWAGVAAAGLFAFSPTVWEYSTSVEVFSLHLLLVALLLFVAVQYRLAPSMRLAYTGALLFGLGMANHHTILFIGVPLAVLLVAQAPRQWLQPIAALRLVGCFALGLSPYLYLVAASLEPAAVTWGDQRTLSGFLTHLLRQEYGTLRLGSAPFTRDVSVAEQFILYARFQVRELLVVGIPLALAGLTTIRVHTPLRSLLAATVCALILYLVVFNVLANLPVGDPLFLGVQQRFWMMPSLLVALWAGIGLAMWTTPLRRAVWPVTLLIVGAQFGAHVRPLVAQRSTAVADYGEWILNGLPPESVLLTRGDLIVNAVQFAQTVRGIRTDVDVVDLERLTYPWMARVVHAHQPRIVLPAQRLAPTGADGFTLDDLIRANVGARRVFLAGNLTPGEDVVNTRYAMWPIGLANEFVPVDRTADTTGWFAASAAALPRFSLPKEAQRRPDRWERLVWLDAWEAHHRRAVKLLELGIATQREDLLAESAAALSAITVGHHDVSPFVFRNLGLAYAYLRPYRTEAAAAMRAAWERYLATGDPRDPQMSAIRAELQRH